MFSERTAWLDSSFSSGEARLAVVEVWDFYSTPAAAASPEFGYQFYFFLRPRPAWPEEPARGTIQNKKQKQHAITSNLADSVLFFHRIHYLVLFR
ncbi:hypothetical protein [Trichococcus shcherbakoviae]|uniref:Uncharacterized protein n=1 Tax=Trichococcus shcherbakoviae subsp. psychrophilus TaxID=2585775 RepID=A0A5C5EBL9_9LACT|nr:hypothetical protein [Trichococcus shcherbakoviae]TNV70003.1 hypothetical protein FHK04_01870 [Trichococcus shcherbakoviae subsp. psychrophilus]